MSRVFFLKLREIIINNNLAEIVDTRIYNKNRITINIITINIITIITINIIIIIDLMPNN